MIASGALLGLLQQPAEPWLKGGAPGGEAQSDAWIEEKLAARTAARKRKNFAAADAIRDEVTAAGVIIEDKPDGTRWRRA